MKKAVLIFYIVMLKLQVAMLAIWFVKSENQNEKLIQTIKEDELRDSLLYSHYSRCMYLERGSFEIDRRGYIKYLSGYDKLIRNGND